MAEIEQEMRAPEGAGEQDERVLLVGDSPKGEAVKPWHLTTSEFLHAWLDRVSASIAFTTYEAGKLVLVGPGLEGKLAVTERDFGQAMALNLTPDGFLLSSAFQVWRFQNGLDQGRVYQGFDHVFLPRSAHITGAVDTHDLEIDKDGRLLAVVTGYNCVAVLDEKGNFNPIWKPPFVTQIVGEDRCHLNGFCLEDGELAYVTVIAETDKDGAWREHRADGGVVMDVRTNEVVARGLSMPHSPRIHDGKLWIAEAGTGWLGWIDRKDGSFNRVTWCPGFVRGLRLINNVALLGCSKPRNKVFKGLPLDEELKRRGCEPECAVYAINTETGKVVHSLSITGSVEEIYDVALLPKVRQPLLVGLQGQEIAQLVRVGPFGGEAPSG